MDLRTYYDSLPAGGRASLAADIEISPAYLYQLAVGIRPIPAARCRAIQAATNGAVTVHELRPDIFGPALSMALKTRTYLAHTAGNRQRGW